MGDTVYIIEQFNKYLGDFDIVGVYLNKDSADRHIERNPEIFSIKTCPCLEKEIYND